MSTYIMPNVVSNVMSNQFTNTETDSEGQDSIPLFHDRPLAQPNDSSYVNTMGSPLMFRARSTLAPFPDAISVLMPTPMAIYLSTGGPRMAAQWAKCCQCSNMINPILAPESTCPICSHVECSLCIKETVP